MTISYELGSSLYINMTNRCTNQCNFCIRYKTDGIGDQESLWLEREPTVEEIIEDLKKRDLSKYKEIVFCGYGEPMMRTYEIIEVSKYIKKNTNLPIRINTNGHGNLIYGKDITPLLEGLIDYISISLNAKNSKEYRRICNPLFGEKAFDAVIDFAKRCTAYVPKVVLTVVDVLPEEDIQECKRIAESINVGFRVRRYSE